jgi:hypothetical protein
MPFFFILAFCPTSRLPDFDFLWYGLLITFPFEGLAGQFSSPLEDFRIGSRLNILYPARAITSYVTVYAHN